MKVIWLDDYREPYHFLYEDWGLHLPPGAHHKGYLRVGDSMSQKLART